ncbi:MAG: 5'-deoxynucleotidase [Christensenellaceae bacterium]|nr:5'-deoxynucleotidase [Christensenellaceae bacterium]
MKYHFFAYISRLKYIKRWNLMRNTREENVQEHSHNVAAIAHALCLIANNIYGKDISEKDVLAYAVYHEAGEVITGDLPTPIKYFNDDITKSYKKIEKYAEDTLTDMLPEELRGDLERYIKGDVPEEVRKIVKAADRLAAYIKCVEEKSSGNREFDKAAVRTLKAINDMNMPEAEYFIENFLPSYEMTLDELN